MAGTVRQTILKGSTAEWESYNPVLLNGEMGYELKEDGNWACKIGDGQKRWTQLDYFLNQYVTAEEMERISKEASTMVKEVQDLVNTIPSDYTALSNQVKDVSDKTNYHITGELGTIIPCYIPIDATFRIFTDDGSNFTPTIIRLLDKDKKNIDYYSLSGQKKNLRELTWDDVPSDTYYVRLEGGTSQNISIDVYSNLMPTIEDFRHKLDRIIDEEPKKLPTYYDPYMADRMETVKNLDTSVGFYGDSFIFITDTHNQNAFNSPLMAKKIIDETAVDRVYLGGDFINEPKTEKDTFKLLRENINKFKGICEWTSIVRGNHDDGSVGGVNTIDVSKLYPILAKPSRKHSVSVYALFYYTDNVTQKIRYYVLDSSNTGTIGDTQAQWFKNSLSALASDWTVVVFVHYGIHNDGTLTDRTNISLFPAGQTIVNCLNTANAKVACVICGHVHIDISYNVGNYHFIATTCDAYGVQATSNSNDDRTAETINEQAFDVFHIDTKNKKVYATRFGGGQNDVSKGTDYTLNDRVFDYR